MSEKLKSAEAIATEVINIDGPGKANFMSPLGACFLGGDVRALQHTIADLIERDRARILDWLEKRATRLDEVVRLSDGGNPHYELGASILRTASSDLRQGKEP